MSNTLLITAGAIIVIVLAILFFNLIPLYKKCSMAWVYMNGRVSALNKELSDCYGYIDHAGRTTFWNFFRNMLYTDNDLIRLKRKDSLGRTVSGGFIIIKKHIYYKGKRTDVAVFDGMMFLKRYFTLPQDQEDITNIIRQIESDIFTECPQTIIIAELHQRNPFCDIFEELGYQNEPYNKLRNPNINKYIKTPDFVCHKQPTLKTKW